MKVDTIVNTAVDTAVTSTALTATPIIDIEQGKAMVIALASSVLVQLAIKGLQFLKAKIFKIGKKDEKEIQTVENDAENS